jgi:hypothetical protein
MRFIKTEAGKKAVSDRSISLSPRQRSALIIFNGERSLEDVLKMVAGLGFTMTDVDQMVEMGLIAEMPELQTSAAALKTSDPLGSMVELDEAQLRYGRAYPLATSLTAAMGLRGFRLNLAVEAAGSYSQLVQLFPKIKDAVGAEKALALEQALQGAV